jgi:hypothetical protein
MRPGALLLSLATYRRAGSPPPARREPSPAEWGAWAARQYARAVMSAALPPEVVALPPRWDPEKRSTVRPLEAFWSRWASYQRKLRAFHLWALADARVRRGPDGEPDPEDPWYPQAFRWSETYLRLPGGDVVQTERAEADLQDLRDLEEVLRIDCGKG